MFDSVRSKNDFGVARNILNPMSKEKVVCVIRSKVQKPQKVGSLVSSLHMPQMRPVTVEETAEIVRTDRTSFNQL